MTPAQLKATRKRLGLSIPWLSKHCPARNGSRGVAVRTWKYWEDSSYPWGVPADVADWITGLDGAMSDFMVSTNEEKNELTQPATGGI